MRAPPAPRRQAPPRPQAPLPPATRRHIASTSSAWAAVCTDLLEAAKDCTNLQGLREPLVSRGFSCRPVSDADARFAVTVPPEFPCYYDLLGKDYASNQKYVDRLAQLTNYLDSVLALAQTGGAYRTEAEYKSDLPVRAKTSRFTGVRRDYGRWRASIRVRVSEVSLGAFDDEADAARAYDAALVKYKGKPTVNFPGEAPLASVLAALPDLPPPPHPAQPAPAPPPPGAPRRSGRAPVPKIKADAPGPLLKCERGLPIQRGSRPRRKSVEGAVHNSNGKWTNNHLFPGHQFDDLDAYRAAKKQRVAQKYR